MPLINETALRIPSKVTKRAPGRPANTGAAQRLMMLEDIDEYRRLKADHASQNAITGVINKEARKIIQHFGWSDPLLATVPAAGEESSSFTLSEEEKKRRDLTFKRVREEVRKVWRENRLPAEVDVADKPSTEIAELIKLFARKPRRKQAYKVWATSQPRPDLEKEVDTQHAAKLRETALVPQPPRVATWNEVASEWYKMAPKKEKKEARKQCRRLHKQDLQRWEAGASADPQSPEEAIEFMEASQSFLSDLMHFFANRASGVAIMFLSGPNGASLMYAAVTFILSH
ncbi:unnamed protein product [Peniophora sp. CBMAI 1063]|nr:unnamed protein product [Peniophora sp. CBMAI 1063]